MAWWTHLLCHCQNDRMGTRSADLRTGPFRQCRLSSGQIGTPPRSAMMVDGEGHPRQRSCARRRAPPGMCEHSEVGELTRAEELEGRYWQGTNRTAEGGEKNPWLVPAVRMKRP